MVDQRSAQSFLSFTYREDRTQGLSMQPSTKNSKCDSPILFWLPNVHVLLMVDIIDLINFKQKGLF